jgi:hypothetical protein
MGLACLFVECQTNAEFVRCVPPEGALRDVDLIVAGNSELPSYARTVAITRRKPIAVLKDADSTNAEKIAEDIQGLEELIRLANWTIPLKIVAAVPVIEAWFFAAPEAIARVLGQPIPSEFLPFGKMDPKGVLQHFAQKQGKQWNTAEAIRQLDADDIAKIREVPEVAALSGFLADVRKDEKAA